MSEVGAAVLYALSILAWFCVARRFGPVAAVATAAALLAYPGYVLLFHQLASDALFAAAFALVALLLARAVELPTAGRSGALGLGVATLVYARPVGQVLLLLGLVPLLAARGRRPRLEAAAAFTAAALLPLAALAGHNAARGDDFTVVRGGSASLLFRTFVADRIVEPGNGTASAELARAVSRGAASERAYRSRGIDLDTFFSSGSSRSTTTSQCSPTERGAGTTTIATSVAWRERRSERIRESTRAVSQAISGGCSSGPCTRLSRSTERAHPLRRRRSRRSRRRRHPRRRADPILARGAVHLHARRTDPRGLDLADRALVRLPGSGRRRSCGRPRPRGERAPGGLPERDPRPAIVERVNDLSRLYPRPFMWLLLGVVAALWRRPRGIAVPAVLSALALLVLFATSLAVYAVAEYSVPVVPAFVLLATAGLLGRRGD